MTFLNHIGKKLRQNSVANQGKASYLNTIRLIMMRSQPNYIEVFFVVVVVAKIVVVVLLFL